MFLCKEQQNPIMLCGRKIYITNQAANAHYYFCKMPITETEAEMYICSHLKTDEIDESKLKNLSDLDISKVIENGVKEEFFHFNPDAKELWYNLSQQESKQWKNTNVVHTH